MFNNRSNEWIFNANPPNLMRGVRISHKKRKNAKGEVKVKSRYWRPEVKSLVQVSSLVKLKTLININDRFEYKNVAKIIA